MKTISMNNWRTCSAHIRQCTIAPLEQPSQKAHHRRCEDTGKRRGRARGGPEMRDKTGNPVLRAISDQQKYVYMALSPAFFSPLRHSWERDTKHEGNVNSNIHDGVARISSFPVTATTGPTTTRATVSGRRNEESEVLTLQRRR